jgi:hypothetical protein
LLKRWIDALAETSSEEVEVPDSNNAESRNVGQEQSNI